MNKFTHDYFTVPFLFSKNWWSFVFGYFFVRVDSDDEDVAESFGLPKRIGMTKMHHVVARSRNAVLHYLLR